jgi:glycosyltransferase involved in cell wall biosynthesis
LAELAILIPTRRRAHLLEPLVANVHQATKTSHRIYFIAQESDEETFEVLERLTSPDVIAVFTGDLNSCAKSTNAGYRASTEPFVFTGNDDVIFHDNWDLAALSKMNSVTHVVGTNDGHGRMSSFALVRRAFIEEHSGVYDRPNTLFHEYLHNYPDTELAEYAKHRGVWDEAPEAVVEHMHPDFGKADPLHANYVQSRETVAEDYRTYLNRKKAWQG